MLVAWLVGRILGAIAQHTVDEHIRQYQAANPLPENIDPVNRPDPPAGEPA